ncbi:MAG: acylphosphatase [Gammaproteobacteria bacterium]|nr:acylphosphatase [Gammaproteobacteria bacterium]MDH5778608.1 acylphosphatase [Gammaproteobacteria bacterium]
MSQCIRCYISGTVQGVFFRASTLEQAQMLGLSGHAKNMGDGRVEVVACGDDVCLEALKRWLQHGPRGAEVTDVDCNTYEPEEQPRGFTTN